MESKRQAQFGRQIQKDLATIFLTNGPRLFGLNFVSVSQVKMTPDLSVARVYLTFMNEREPKAAVALIRTATKEVRNLLSNKIGKVTRKVPELEFFYDDTLDVAERMEKLFQDLNSKPKSPEPDKEDYKG